MSRAMHPMRVWQERWSARSQRGASVAARRWQALSARERRSVGLAGAVLALLLVWSFLIDPAITRLDRAAAEIPRLQAQRAELDALVREAQALGGRAKLVLPAAAQQEGLVASLAAAGLASAVVPTQDDEGRWQLAVGEVSAPVLLQWLADIVEPIRLRPITLDLTRVKDAGGRPVPGKLTGSILLADIADPEAPK
jgi:general secretion pathway protein M